jgi:hypothetical protein
MTIDTEKLKKVSENIEMLKAKYPGANVSYCVNTNEIRVELPKNTTDKQIQGFMVGSKVSNVIMALFSKLSEKDLCNLMVELTALFDKYKNL